MLKPLSDRVLIKILEKEEKTKNGIILGVDNEESKIAEVIEVGKGTDDIKMEVNKGDKIIIDKFAGTEIKYEGEKFIVIKQEDILSIII